ncbi:MAG: efflux RND transporter periplasmic adaptor subunit [Gammaproteobacteria bacterium]|nr:efflux RND transporter periplasmic adaptor subunit [Gammaproteobacteria bacterium]
MKNNTLTLILFSSLLLPLGSSLYAQQEHNHAHDETSHKDTLISRQAPALELDQHADHDHAGHGGLTLDMGDAKQDTHQNGDRHAHDDIAGGKPDDGHGHAGHDDHEEGVALSRQQLSLAKIRVASLSAQQMDFQVYAPGEIKANGYTSYLVSPRVDSVVLRRSVALGDHVEKGKPLVTLFSETVAESQAAFRVANAEWQRVEKLGKKAIGDRRFIAAQTDYEAAYGRLIAYGLSQDAIQSLTRKNQNLGEYTLYAAISGAVLSDDFHQGQRVEAGQALMELADEHELWVEARLAPTANLELPTGTLAQVRVGNEWFAARVAQEAHTIDPQTRTRVVRLLVNNDAHRLHPGLFADVYFVFTTEHAVLAVPEAALMRSADGDWTVFVETEAGQFKAQEVVLGRSLGQWREINGVAAGTRVVIEGAFFVASQIAKGGFDPHNH